MDHSTPQTKIHAWGTMRGWWWVDHFGIDFGNIPHHVDMSWKRHNRMEAREARKIGVNRERSCAGLNGIVLQAVLVSLDFVGNLQRQPWGAIGWERGVPLLMIRMGAFCVRNA